ncbi:WXG100 family type VII secretion target [Mycolicibacterium mageritense]|uniref:WXG100 family type VII secretion target n=1 Tax=Mycolicibacterium mageritense TaxID=53462 RepID=UPI0011DA978B|nr:WXG100 family type VII secretion target [Mycolicibacterium mageritense]TXI55754.1 MAG: WXG100 family type VII secretion target [Mycolicibacterium mageritense]
MALKVSPEELQAASNDIRGMIHEYNGALQNYLTQTEGNMGAGGWNGPASNSNYTATQDIHQAQTNLTTRWGNLCDTLDKAASDYAEQERINADKQGAVAL